MLLACWILASTEIGAIKEVEVIVETTSSVETAVVGCWWRKSPDSAKRRVGNGGLLCLLGEVVGADLLGDRILVLVVYWQGELVRMNPEADEFNGLW